MRQVATELVEHERGGRRAGLSAGATGFGGLLALVARQQLDDLLADAVEIGTELDQNLGCYALTLTDETEQDVLRTDVVVSELQALRADSARELSWRAV